MCEMMKKHKIFRNFLTLKKIKNKSNDSYNLYQTHMGSKGYHQRNVTT